jgi:hypothetical protein
LPEKSNVSNIRRTRRSVPHRERPTPPTSQNSSENPPTAAAITSAEIKESVQLDIRNDFSSTLDDTLMKCSPILTQKRESDELETEAAVLSYSVQQMDLDPYCSTVTSIRFSCDGDEIHFMAPAARNPSCSSPDISTSTLSPTFISPRVAELKKKMTSAENKLNLHIDFLDAEFKGITSDMDHLTTRTEPVRLLAPNCRTRSPSATSPKVPALGKIPALSLNMAKTMVREETVEGAQAIDYMEDARMISERLISERMLLLSPVA